MLVVDCDGNMNIYGVKVVYCVGEQEQILLEGFELFGVEMVFGVQVRYDNLVIRIIMVVNIDCLCFMFGVQLLVEVNSKGDCNLIFVRL